MWHPAFTPAKVTGMILAAGYSVPELHTFATDGMALGEVALEALELITEQMPPIVATWMDPTPVVRRPRLIDQMPVYQVLTGPAARAIRTMRPLAL